MSTLLTDYRDLQNIPLMWELVNMGACAALKRGTVNESFIYLFIYIEYVLKNQLSTLTVHYIVNLLMPLCLYGSNNVKTVLVLTFPTAPCRSGKFSYFNDIYLYCMTMKCNMNDTKVQNDEVVITH